VSQLGQLVSLLAIHWFADFVLQTDWQARNKSKDNVALARHVGTYTLALTMAAIGLLGFSTAILFGLINGILHFATDYVTSRITSRLYAKQAYHNFFVVVGLDQLIHQVTLAATLWMVV
jgi:Protein of unknown function (DUF3307)